MYIIIIKKKERKEKEKNIYMYEYITLSQNSYRTVYLFVNDFSPASLHL